jgi:hypothetical protein
MQPSISSVGLFGMTDQGVLTSLGGSLYGEHMWQGE